MDYQQKYYKYKVKYINLKKKRNTLNVQHGGAFATESDLLSMFDPSNRSSIETLLNDKKYNEIEKIISEQKWNNEKQSKVLSVLAQLKLPDEIKIQILKNLPMTDKMTLLSNPVNKDAFRLFGDYEILFKDIFVDYEYARRKNIPIYLKKIIPNIANVTDTNELQYYENLNQIKFNENFNENINDKLPISVRYIYFGEKFQNGGIQLNLKNLIYLQRIEFSFMGIFNQNINDALPNSLVTLILNSQFRNNNIQLDLRNLNKY